MSSKVPLGAPYMLSRCPPWWEQCHHPAGNPKAGKHQQGALLWHIGAAVWHSWASSVDNIDPDSHDPGSVYRGKQDRGFVALCCSAGQRGTALQNNHWKGSVPPIKRRKKSNKNPIQSSFRTHWIRKPSWHNQTNCILQKIVTTWWVSTSVGGQLSQPTGTMFLMQIED